MARPHLAIRLFGAHGGSILYSGKKTLITWDQIVKKQVTDEIIVLLTSNGILSFFPRGFFRSEGDWKRATELVESNLKKLAG